MGGHWLIDPQRALMTKGTKMTFKGPTGWADLWSFSTDDSKAIKSRWDNFALKSKEPFSETGALQKHMEKKWGKSVNFKRKRSDCWKIKDSCPPYSHANCSFQRVLWKLDGSFVVVVRLQDRVQIASEKSIFCYLISVKGEMYVCVIDSNILIMSVFHSRS